MRRKIRISFDDMYFVHELVERGFYERMEDVFKDAIRGSYLKEELKNTSRWNLKRREKIIMRSLHEYLNYLSHVEIDGETLKKIKGVISGETNSYEKKFERIERSQEPKKEPLPYKLMDEINYYNIDLEQRIKEWREKEGYDPNFDVNIKIKKKGTN